MRYSISSIEALREKLDKKEVTSEELFKKSIELAKKYQSDYNSFVTIMDEFKEEKSTSILAGIPYALKDNFSTKGILTTASSNILKDYVPVYDATVYKKLKEAGAVLVGKTVMDELAMGGTATTGNTGSVKNPWDKNHLMGGSSGGSASSVALGIVPFSIGSDTGDSIRNPAGWGGIIGYKPTYGLVSRYGLFAFTSSMDHVGCFTRSVKDVASVLDIIKGKDANDMVTYEDNTEYGKSINKEVSGMKVCEIKEIKEALKITPDVYDNYLNTINKLKELGVTVEEVSIDKDLLKSIYPAYFVISCAEATSNNSNLTGILFGPREKGKNVDEIMFNTRTKGFSELIKRRFIQGSYILQKENQEKLFKNGQRIRRMIVNRVTEIFNTYDAFIIPNSMDIAPKFEDQPDRLSDEYLILQQALAIANFGGFPSLSIPCGIIRNMPVAVNITAAVKKDLTVLNLGLALEEKIGFKYLDKGDE